MAEKLQKITLNGGQVLGNWQQECQLSVPVVKEKIYCLAQLDDYMALSRRRFPHRPPFHFQLTARVSQSDCAGTWGFGLWNDPFNMGGGLAGPRRIFPVLPNAAWFFYGSPENYLSLRDVLPGGGFHARTFQSPLIPGMLSLLALPALPLLMVPTAAQLLRRLARVLVKEEAIALNLDVTDWHSYEMAWEIDRVKFMVDGDTVLSTALAPKGRLGFVLWIDNQAFSFDPQGKVSYAYLRTQEKQTLTIQNLTMD